MSKRWKDAENILCIYKVKVVDRLPPMEMRKCIWLSCRMIFDNVSCQVPWKHQTSSRRLTVACSESWCPTTVADVLRTKPLTLCSMHNIRSNLLGHLNALILLYVSVSSPRFTSVQQDLYYNEYVESFLSSNPDGMAARP